MTILSTTCRCHVNDLFNGSRCALVEWYQQLPLSLRRSGERVRPRSVAHCVSSTSVSSRLVATSRVVVWCCCSQTEMDQASLRLQSQRHTSATSLRTTRMSFNFAFLSVHPATCVPSRWTARRPRNLCRWLILFQLNKRSSSCGVDVLHSGRQLYSVAQSLGSDPS